MKTPIENLKNRRSIRKFKPDMLPKLVLTEIVEAGTYAPTGKNTQSPIIIVVTDPVQREKIRQVNVAIGGWAEDYDPFYGAPVILVVLANKKSYNHVYDGTLVRGNLMLAAHALGVGSCWINRAKQAFEMDEWKEWLRSLGIEGEYEGIGNIALGYPDGPAPKAAPRKDDWVYWVE